MARKQAVRVSLGWLFLAFSIVIGSYIVASSQINAQKVLLVQQESHYRVALSRLETERAALEKEISLAGTDAYIENLARTQYGFLKPGEIRFEITNPEALFTTSEKADIRVVTD